MHAAPSAQRTVPLLVPRPLALLAHPTLAHPVAPCHAMASLAPTSGNRVAGVGRPGAPLTQARRIASRRTRHGAPRAAERDQTDDRDPWATLSVDELEAWSQDVRRRPACRCCRAWRAGRPRYWVRAPPQGTGPPTPLLDTVNFPVHLKNLGPSDLKKLCKELRAGALGRPRPLRGDVPLITLRPPMPGGPPPPPPPPPPHTHTHTTTATTHTHTHADLIHSVAKTGGHLGSSLGVVELTLALHYVFNTPEDKIIFDVGHQAYIHKMLTGRRSRMHTIRQQGGLSGAACAHWQPVSASSCCRLCRCPAVAALPRHVPPVHSRRRAGFTKRAESPYDPFGAGHSSTSISAALGMAVGRDVKGRKNNVVAVSAAAVGSWRHLAASAAEHGQQRKADARAAHAHMRCADLQVQRHAGLRCHASVTGDWRRRNHGRHGLRGYEPRRVSRHQHDRYS